jgi:hypothetical protein
MEVLGDEVASGGGDGASGIEDASCVEVQGGWISSSDDDASVEEGVSSVEESVESEESFDDVCGCSCVG